MTNTVKLNSYGTYAMHVIQYPSGKFGYVGSLPEIFTAERTQMSGLKYNASLVFDTEAEAIQFYNDNKHLVIW